MLPISGELLTEIVDMEQEQRHKLYEALSNIAQSLDDAIDTSNSRFKDVHSKLDTLMEAVKSSDQINTTVIPGRPEGEIEDIIPGKQELQWDGMGFYDGLLNAENISVPIKFTLEENKDIPSRVTSNIQENQHSVNIMKEILLIEDKLDRWTVEYKQLQEDINSCLHSGEMKVKAGDYVRIAKQNKESIRKRWNAVLENGRMRTSEDKHMHGVYQRLFEYFDMSIKDDNKTK